MTKDKIGFKTTLTQRAYHLSEALETLNTRVSTIEALNDILNNQIDILEIKHPLLENRIQSLEIHTSRIQTIEEYIVAIKDQLIIISNDRDRQALVSKIEELNTLRDELNEFKETILPDEKDFYNLSRQIENLNRRLSLLESKPQRGVSLRHLAIGIGTLIAITAAQIISLIYFY